MTVEILGSVEGIVCISVEGVVCIAESRVVIDEKVKRSGEDLSKDLDKE